MNAKSIRLALIAFSILTFLVQANVALAQVSKWTVLDEAKDLKNTLEKSDRVLNAGNQIYIQLCAVCHGNKGAGDGITAAALQPKPADFTSSDFQEQSDGTIFYKIREGRPPMPGFKTQLSEQQTWAIVHYLRSLSEQTTKNQ